MYEPKGDWHMVCKSVLNLMFLSSIFPLSTHSGLFSISSLLSLSVFFACFYFCNFQPFLSLLKKLKLVNHLQSYTEFPQTGADLSFTTLPQRLSKALASLSVSFWNGPVMYAQHKQNTGVLTNTPSLQATVRSPLQHISANTHLLTVTIPVFKR